MNDESKSLIEKPRVNGCIFGLLLSGVILCVAAMYMLKTSHAWYETIETLDIDRPVQAGGFDGLGFGLSVFACLFILLATGIISIVILLFSKSKSIRMAAIFPFLASVVFAIRFAMFIFETMIDP